MPIKLNPKIKNLIPLPLTFVVFLSFIFLLHLFKNISRFRHLYWQPDAQESRAERQNRDRDWHRSGQRPGNYDHLNNLDLFQRGNLAFGFNDYFSGVSSFQNG